MNIGLPQSKLMLLTITMSLAVIDFRFFTMSKYASKNEDLTPLKISKNDSQANSKREVSKMFCIITVAQEKIQSFPKSQHHFGGCINYETCKDS